MKNKCKYFSKCFNNSVPFKSGLFFFIVLYLSAGGFQDIQINASAHKLLCIFHHPKWQLYFTTFSNNKGEIENLRKDKFYIIFVTINTERGKYLNVRCFKISS